jgi:hypothetical protein
MSDKVRSFDLINPVLHRGSMSSQIIAALGDVLELAFNGTFVRVIPNPSSKRDAFLVPMSNVKKLVIVDEAAEAAVAKAKADAETVRTRHEAKNSAPKSVLKGIEKFVKDENGQIKTVII